MVEVYFPRNRRKVALDFDEVIVPCLVDFLSFYNHKYRTNFSVKDFNSYKWWENLSISKREIYEIADEYFAKIGYDCQHLFENGGYFFGDYIQGAEEGIELLSRFYELSVITDRHPDLIEECAHYSSQLHFLDLERESVFPDIRLPSGDYEPLVLPMDRFYFTRELNKSKAQVCLENDITTIVDDNLEVAMDCAKQGLEVLLFSKPWNINFDENDFISEGRIVRVNNWQEICNYLVQDYVFPVPNVFIEENRPVI